MALAALEGGMGTLEVLDGLVAEPIGTRVSSVFLLQPPQCQGGGQGKSHCACRLEC